MKKKILTFGSYAAKIGSFALALSFVACGDDGGSNSMADEVKGEVIALADGSGEKVCDDKLDGWVAEAVGKDFRRCQNGEWTKITANEASAEEEIIGGVTVLLSSSSIKDSEPAKGFSSSNEYSSSSVVLSSSSCVMSEVERSSSSIASSSSIVSSSSAKSSSSDSESKAAWQYLNPDIDYGEFTDTRDGQVYKTVKICDDKNQNCQTWMAENLNYAYKGVSYKYSNFSSDSISWCIGDDLKNCATYGRLYTWAAAVDSAGVADTNGAGRECGFGKTCAAASPNLSTLIRGVCPNGWHLPSNVEWSALYENIGGTSIAGQKLKADVLWSPYSGVSNDDDYGFSILPADERNNDGSFGTGRYFASFWSSSEYNGNTAMYQHFYWNYGHVFQNNSYKSYGMSVRCLKD